MTPTNTSELMLNFKKKVDSLNEVMQKLQTAFPTWKCDECSAEFKFIPITPVNEQVERKHPMVCPYCGRWSNVGAPSDERTTFTEVGIVR